VSLIRLETSKLYTEKVNTWKWEDYARFDISKDGDGKYREVICFNDDRREWLRHVYKVSQADQSGIR
jgi:hypothetical protein